MLCRGRSRRCSSNCTLRRSASRCVGRRCVSRWSRARCQARRRSKSGLVISGSSVLLDLPRSQRNGAPRRLRCRRACGSTRGLCISAGVRTPDSGHTDSLVRLDNNRSPLSRWDDLFYFAERVSNKISSSGQRRGRRRSAVNHFRFKALGRTQPPGPKPLVGHLRTPNLGVLGGVGLWPWRCHLAG